DDVGYGWVVCAPDEADKYRRLLAEGTDIESRLPGRLAEHLNAEVALGTIADVDDVTDWLATTFYYVRAESAPERYGTDIGERAREAVEELVERGFVEQSDLELSPTPLGRLTSTYYLRPATAERFAELARDLPDGQRAVEERVFRAVARAEEFGSVSARRDERAAVDPLAPGDMEPGARKVFAILRASMRGSVPQELRGDAWVIRQNALRLAAALAAFAGEFGGPVDAAAVRRVEARIEHGVPRDATGLVAIDGVGSGRAHKLADEGIASPGAVRAAGPDALAAAGLSAGVAERVHESAADLPRATIEWGEFPESVVAGGTVVEEVTVRNEGGGARAGVRVTVNGVEATRREAYLGDEMEVLVAADAAEDLEFTVEVAFPEYPLAPVVETRTVLVE
ncbi:MAG: DEAD/DEAH box helicase, partial [Halobacteriaceae archaeon]